MTQPYRSDNDAMAALNTARALLTAVTPLQGDCGRHCGAACCRPDVDGEGGMYLFPGESALYPSDLCWAKIVPTDFAVAGQAVPLLVCKGTCPREDRPLACRIFPLIARCHGEELTVWPDIRAWSMCPLMPHGLQGLSPAFVATVRAAFDILWAIPVHRAFLTALDGMLRDLATL